MKKWPIVLSSHIVSLSLSLSSRFLPCVPPFRFGGSFLHLRFGRGAASCASEDKSHQTRRSAVFWCREIRGALPVFFFWEGVGGTIGLVRASHLCTSLLLHFTSLPLLTLGVLSKVVRMQVDESWDTKSMGQQQHVENTCGSLLRELQVCLSIRVSELLCAHLGTFFSDQGSTWNALELYAKHMGLCNAHGVLWVLQMQQIWDEVGENDSERDKMLLQLEQECLEVYRRKVERASHARAQLHQDLANSEAELAALFSALGDPAVSRVSLTDLPAAPTASHLCNNVHTRKNSQNKTRSVVDFILHVG